MRRLNVAVVLIALLTASLVAAGVAYATGVVAPKQVTAAVLPKHINPPSIAKAKYTWHVKGKVIAPAQYCPHGANVPPYCEKVPPSACNGKITWTAVMGKDSLLNASKKTIGKGSTTVRKCAYRFSHHFKTSLFIANRKLGGFSSVRHVGVLFYIRFDGNSILKPKSARRQTVIAKVLEPGI